MSDAFDLILGVYRSPARAALLRTHTLPHDAINIIRVAAGDSEAMAAARETTQLREADLNEAARLVLHHLLFFDGADSYRTLGVPHDAQPQQIKHHYRWLVKWLHPDRDPDNMHSVFVDRINRAWNSVRNPERRASYDQSLAAGILVSENTLGTMYSPTLLHNFVSPLPSLLLSGHTVRRLPQMVALGGVVIVAALLGLMTWLHTVEPTFYTRPSPPYLDLPPVPISPIDAALPTRDFPFSSSPTPLQLGPTVHSPRERAEAPALTSISMPSLSILSSVAPIAPEISGGTAERLPVSAPMLKTVKTQQPYPMDARNEMSTRMSSLMAPSANNRAVSLVESDVIAFVERFQRLYSTNDIDQFLALFSTTVKGNDDSDFADIAADYRRLFDQRRLRQLSLSGMQWQLSASSALGRGHYVALIGASADKADHRTHGTIILGLQRESDGVHITQLRHTVSD